MDLDKAIALWARSDPNGHPPDLSVPSQPPPATFKKHNSHCKQAHTMELKEKHWSPITHPSLDVMIKIKPREPSRRKDTSDSFLQVSIFETVFFSH